MLRQRRCVIEYKAFISYSHLADARIAPALQSAIQKFGKPFLKRSRLQIYCDRTDLNVSPGLWTSIQSQLRNCSHLILLASPKAAESVWVNREVETWLSLRDGSVENLSIVLTEGEIVWDPSHNDFDWTRTTSLPQALRARFSEEPKYEDARELRNAQRLTMRDRVFEDVVASVAARLQGKSKRELIGEELRQQRRQRKYLTAVAGVMAILAGLASYEYWVASETAVRERHANEQLIQSNKKLDETNDDLKTSNTKLEQSLASEREARQLADQRQLAAQAELTLNQQPGLLPESVLLALQSIGTNPESPSLEAYQTLERGLSLLPEEVRRLTLNDAPVALSLSATGNRLATATKNVIEVWDAASLRRIVSWRVRFPIEDAQISSDGTRLALAGQGTVTVFELPSSGSAVKEIGSYGVRPPQRVALSPTGKLVASTTLGSALRVFTVGERTQLREGSHGGIQTVAFSADESYLISGGRDGILFTRIQDGRTARCSFSNATHVAISRDGHYGAIALQTGVIEVRRLDPGGTQPCGSPQSFPHQGRLTAISLSDDGGYTLTASYDGTARVWNLARGREVARGTHSSSVTHVVSGHVRGSFWTAGADRTVKLWEVRSSREQLRHTAPVRTITFTPDNRLITASENGSRRVWRSSGTSFVESIDEEQSASMGVFEEPHAFESSAASPDGQVMSMQIDDGTAYLWRTTDKAGFEFMTELTEVTATAVSNGGLYFAVGSASNKVDVHKGVDGGTLHRRFEASGPITALAFDARSITLAAGTDNGVVHTWRLSGSNTPRRQSVGSAIQSLTFTPDGRRIAAGTSAGGILLLDAESLSELQRYGKDTDSFALAIAPGGRYLAAAGLAGVIRIWDLVSQRQVGVITHAARVHSLAFSLDGRLLAAGAEDQLAAVFLWEPEDLLREACSRLAKSGNNTRDLNVCSAGPSP